MSEKKVKSGGFVKAAALLELSVFKMKGALKIKTTTSTASAHFDTSTKLHWKVDDAFPAAILWGYSLLSEIVSNVDKNWRDGLHMAMGFQRDLINRNSSGTFWK